MGLEENVGLKVLERWEKDFEMGLLNISGFP